MVDFPDVQNAANDLKTYSMNMMIFTMNVAKDGINLDFYAKMVNNFMNKPDKVNSTN